MRRWISLLACSGMGACGPSSAPVAEGGTSVAEESDSEDPSESGADTVSAESTDTGVVDVCEEILDAPPSGETVILEIRNVGSQGILLADPCSSLGWIELSTDSEWKWPLDFCSGTCQQTFEEGCFDCGACAEAAYVVLPPASRIAVEWDRRLYERMMAPDSCFGQDNCAPSCEVARAVPTDETILVTVEAITEADCTDGEPAPEETCHCDPGPDGWCETLGSALIDPTVLGTAEIDASTTGPVVVELSG